MTQRVPAWDFSNAKGTGAEVVSYDPGADLSSGTAPTQPKRPPPRLREPSPRTLARILQELQVERIAALSLAYRLAATELAVPIPHDLRLAMARLTERVGGSRVLQDRILRGDYDEWLASLLA